MPTSYTIPTRTDIPRYRARINLGNEIYQFFFYWNDREEAWHFDLSDVDGNVLVNGIKVTLRIPLLRKLASHDMPRGDLVAIDTDGTNIKAGLNDLGSRVILVYYDDETIQ